MATQSTQTFVTLALMILSVPIILPAQALQDPAPIKSWQAPLYWQPNGFEEQASRARLGMSAAIVSLSTDVGTQAQTPANSLVFVGMTPCRVVDTRTGSGFTGAFGPPSLVGGASRTFPIQSSSTCSIPPIAQAYSFNITLVTTSFVDYITVWPTGQPRPNASTLNGYVNTVIANAAVLPAGTSGSVDVYASQNTNLIIDINGYYGAQSGITLAQGTVGAPSLSFAGDPGTGIFSSGVGTLNMATGGTNRLTLRADGDLDLAGNIRKGGSLFLHSLGVGNTGVGLASLAVNTGQGNTASGASALFSNTIGNGNTATGQSALYWNTTGSRNTAIGLTALGNNTTGADNTALGYNALASNTTGNNNSASGRFALFSNTTGTDNAALGYYALFSNTTGDENTAIGNNALNQNTTGFYNTAVGRLALANNTTGTHNTATGTLALSGNTTGLYNTASGMQSLSSNTTGSSNTASGNNVLYGNTTGNANTASGFGALLANQTGSNNIAIGYLAGQLITSHNNIDIGNVGESGDLGTIRIGTSHTRTFIAGIRGRITGIANAVNVVIDSDGQLGTISSSRRFKEDIQDMGESSSGLLRLRPVTFRYKKPYKDGSKPLDYGLIAEEVEEVFPDLVVKGADGQVETVQYQKLTPILLNEVQKQHEQLEQQAQTIRMQQEQNKKLEDRLAALEELLLGMGANPTGPAGH